MPDDLGHAPLIGRERELAQLRKVLERRRPALVLVTGPVGVGKTVVLQAVDGVARQLGWSVAHQDAEGPLQIDPTTTSDEFCIRVSQLLDLIDEGEPAAPAGILEAVPASDVGRHPDAVVPSRLRALARRLRGLAHAAPVLLLVDSYQPEPGFEREFVRVFVRELARDRAPVVLMVADRPRSGRRRLPATDTVEIGPPGAAAIKRYFQELGRGLDPPMEPAELDTYVDLGHDTPESITGLAALLELTATDVGRDGAGG